MTRELFSCGADDPVLEGVLERFVYVNAETGWSVASLLPEGASRSVVIVGLLGGTQPGETLCLRGTWEEDRRFGRQFRIAAFQSKPPSSLEAIEKYLASGLIRGIGPVLAKRLVAHFKEDTLRVLDEASSRLREVPGLGRTRAASIRTAWKEQRDLKEIVMFLQAHGIRPSYALRIFRTYGANALTHLRQDPYCLAQDIAGIGFRRADDIALALGLPADAAQRLEAALFFVLEEASERGHCFLPRPALYAQTVRLLAPPPRDGEPARQEAPMDRGHVDATIARLAARNAVVVETQGDLEAVYSPRLFDLEVRCATRLTELLRDRLPALVANPARALAESTLGALELSPSQKRAAEAALRSRLLVITGGPGTGKTTLVRTLLGLLEPQRLQVVLCAPTGRAARRLTEATSHEASTLHRLLEWSPRDGRFLRNARTPLDGDVFVVDETSMVDLPLMHHLLEALPRQGRVVFVGDADQLPSVGPGNLLRDMIASERIPTARLTELFRQDENSMIVHNAHRIRQGLRPDLPAPGRRSDFVLVEREDPPALVETLRLLLSTRLPDSLGVDPRRDVQVLTPMNRGPLGTAALNEELQQLLNAEGAPIASTGLRVGDKVMQTRNNYDLEVFNGDVGLLEAYDAEERRAQVRFDERRVEYALDELDELVLAYATTVHKSQGSEYPVVVFLLHLQHFVMLQRNLLYTAVTRARRQVVLLGQQRALQVALSTVRRHQRHTFLDERLRQRLPALPAADSPP